MARDERLRARKEAIVAANPFLRAFLNRSLLRYDQSDWGFSVDRASKPITEALSKKWSPDNRGNMY